MWIEELHYAISSNNFKAAHMLARAIRCRVIMAKERGEPMWLSGDEEKLIIIGLGPTACKFDLKYGPNPCTEINLPNTEGLHKWRFGINPNDVNKGNYYFDDFNPHNDTSTWD
jgi:hypothetical protein